MANGTIKRLVRDRGFGFIRDDGGQEWFFHRSSVKTGTFGSQLNEGQRVAFDEALGEGTPGRYIRSETQQLRNRRLRLVKNRWRWQSRARGSAVHAIGSDCTGEIEGGSPGPAQGRVWCVSFRSSGSSPARGPWWTLPTKIPHAALLAATRRPRPHGTAMEEMLDAAFIANEAEPFVDEEACDSSLWHGRVLRCASSWGKSQALHEPLVSEV